MYDVKAHPPIFVDLTVEVNRLNFKVTKAINMASGLASLYGDTEIVGK